MQYSVYSPDRSIVLHVEKNKGLTRMGGQKIDLTGAHFVAITDDGLYVAFLRKHSITDATMVEIYSAEADQWRRVAEMVLSYTPTAINGHPTLLWESQDKSIPRLIIQTNRGTVKVRRFGMHWVLSLHLPASAAS